MATGFVLLATAIRAERRVLQDLQSLDKVVEAEMLFGAYDIIARIEGDSASLAAFPEILRGLPGVEDVVWYGAQEIPR